MGARGETLDDQGEVQLPASGSALSVACGGDDGAAVWRVAVEVSVIPGVWVPLGSYTLPGKGPDYRPAFCVSYPGAGRWRLKVTRNAGSGTVVLQASTGEAQPQEQQSSSPAPAPDPYTVNAEHGLNMISNGSPAPLHVRTGPTVLYAVHVQNPSANPMFVAFWDSASAPDVATIPSNKPGFAKGLLLLVGPGVSRVTAEQFGGPFQFTEGAWIYYTSTGNGQPGSFVADAGAETFWRGGAWV